MILNEVSVSVGSVYGKTEENLEEMLKEADHRMYIEKKSIIRKPNKNLRMF